MSGIEPGVASTRTMYAVLRVVHGQVEGRPATWSTTADLRQVRDELIRELAERGQPVFVIMLRANIPARVVRMALAGTQWSPWGAR